MAVFMLNEDKLLFPDPRLGESDGLVAVGGDLSVERLLAAYCAGIFPWFSGPGPILWWSPDPRLVLFPDRIRVSKTLRRVFKRGTFRFTIDRAFEYVIRSCAQVRLEKGEGTWLGEEMIDAYCRLHRAGYAHSVEAWQGDVLAGGLYGVAIGRCFFGESMFTRISNASKAALVKLGEFLCANGFEIIDCQVTTAHLKTLGAVEIDRDTFLRLLRKALEEPVAPVSWNLDTDLSPKAAVGYVSRSRQGCC